MNSYRYSSDANADIEEIVLHIFDLIPSPRTVFSNRLKKPANCWPNIRSSSRLRAELGEGLRSFPVGNYLIFYTPAADGIDVARIIYGGRDLPGIFRK